MRVMSVGNYNTKSQNFGYNLPKNTNLFYENMYGTTNECLSYREKQFCGDTYNQFMKAVEAFVNARFDVTELIEKYFPDVVKYNVQDKFYKFLHGFNSEVSVDDEGKKHFKINADVSDMFFEEEGGEKHSGDLREYFDMWGKLKTQHNEFTNIPGYHGNVGYSINCGYEIPVKQANGDAIDYLHLYTIQSLQNQVNSEIGRYFEQGCEKIIKEGKQVQTQIQQ